MTAGLLWIDPFGVTHNLTDPNSFYWVQGATGMFMPGMDLQEQGVPLQPGSIMRLTLAKPRDVNLPILVKGVSAADFYNNLEEVCSMFYSATTQAPGTLRRTTPNGHTRDLQCFYAGGAEGDESIDNSGAAHMYMVVGLRGCTPFWFDSTPTVQTFTPSGPVNFFGTPFLPLQLSPAGLSSSFTIINSGDDVAWPTWAIHGPATNPTLTNTYTAPNGAVITKTLALTITLGSSDILTIQTKPVSITKQDGSNQFGAISPTSSLWSLQPGVNLCGISMSSTGANSEVTLTYKQCYLAP
jgi:hypothetical protein